MLWGSGSSIWDWVWAFLLIGLSVMVLLVPFCLLALLILRRIAKKQDVKVKLGKCEYHSGDKKEKAGGDPKE